MSTVSSPPILPPILRWGGIVGGVILLVAGAVGFIVAGAPGLWSGVLGALIGVVFPALTAVTILIGNIWFGTVHYLEIFFGVVLGGWIVKLILAIVLLVALVGQPWVQPIVLYFSLVAAAVGSLAVDLVALARMRLPAVSDVQLPGGEHGSGSNSASDI